ncbi:MAG: hypothetical protein K8U03_13020 [Planctomycetia bacterium]|nr:hypothetical protein [Planctomycetia bacterium]
MAMRQRLNSWLPSDEYQNPNDEEMPVELRDLACIKQTPNFSRRPLTELELLDHIHGCLIIQPNRGTPFHNFGYWDLNDACIGQWLAVFTQLRKRFGDGGNFTYEFPYPDQGEPKLEFIFNDETVLIRTTFFTDDSWTKIEDTVEQFTTRAEFESLISEALRLIEITVLTASPTNGSQWLKRNRDE